MPQALRSSLIVLAVVVISFLGLRRLSFETDVLKVLPADIPEVQALEVFRNHFDNDQQVIVLMHHDEEVFEEDAKSLTEHLRTELGEGRVEYRSRFEDDPESFAASLARMWADHDPAEVAQLVTTLKDPVALRALLEESRDKVSLSLDQEEATMTSYDPLGFLQHPTMAELKDNEFSHQSEDGKYWLIMVAAEDLEIGYQYHQDWVDRIRAATESWTQPEGDEDEVGYRFFFTGGPVYSAEIGSGMEKDMSGTITATSIIVGLLFLLVQRSPIQLLVLAGILGLVFLITLGFAGWIFGSMNLMSVGFAAILMGLVIDYGVVIAREARPGQTAAELRREMTPSVLWAALTTAIVFGLLIMSSFTGVRQLGGMILIGLVTGAIICLWIMPIAMTKFPPKKVRSLVPPVFLSARNGMIVLAVILAGLIATFSIKGPPEVSFNVSMVQPESSEAAQTFEVIQDQFPAWSKRNVSLIVQGESLTEVRESLEFAAEGIARLREKGVLIRSEWPVKVLPNEENRAANAALWKEASAEVGNILRAMEEAGFSEKGRALDRKVLEALGGPIEGEDHFAKVFYHEDGFFSGRVQLARDLDAGNAEELKSLNQKGVTATGWEMLQLVLLPLVKQDFYQIFLPTTFVLLAALWMVFRSFKDAMMTAGLLVIVLLMVNALVVLRGDRWNFLSSMAIPLIVGTGIDYSIHLVYALRRSGGDLKKVWEGVGKAICFCGLSTVVGFGSLAFASNQMLQSMGTLCGAGVFLTMSLSILIVPGLWIWNHRKE